MDKILDASDIKKIHELIYSNDNKKRIAEDHERYMVYNGKLKEAIKKAIQKEYIRPETVSEMIHRIIPINIVNKIVTKLARVYIQNPIREPVEELDQDKEALSYYEDILDFNRKMKNANRLFKLYKITSIEPFPSSDRIPKIRIVPSFSFTLYSDDIVDPAKETAYIKHLNWDNVESSNDRHLIWTNLEEILINGAGEVLYKKENSYNKIPAVFIRENDEFLMPVADDDLISVQYAICLLLTDLSFAAKYQSWSIFTLTTTEAQDAKQISMNPNSVVLLQYDRDGNKPELNTVKPTLDSDAMLRQIESLLGMLLTTKSLSIGNVSTKLDAQTASSGIAKILDQAETTEDRTDQIEYFKVAEWKLWDLFSQYMLPVWAKSGLIKPEYYMPFSKDFQLRIIFENPKPYVSEKDQIETSKLAIDAGLSSQKREISKLNPDMTDQEIEDLINEIDQEAVRKLPVVTEIVQPNNQDNLNGKQDAQNQLQ